MSFLELILLIQVYVMSLFFLQYERRENGDGKNGIKISGRGEIVEHTLDDEEETEVIKNEN